MVLTFSDARRLASSALPFARPFYLAVIFGFAARALSYAVCNIIPRIHFWTGPRAAYSDAIFLALVRPSGAYRWQTY